MFDANWSTTSLVHLSVDFLVHLSSSPRGQLLCGHGRDSTCTPRDVRALALLLPASLRSLSSDSALPLVKSIRMIHVNTRRPVSTVAQDIAHFFRGCLTRGKSSCVDLRSSVKCRNLSTSGQHIQSGAVRHAILISLLVLHEVSFSCLNPCRLSSTGGHAVRHSAPSVVSWSSVPRDHAVLPRTASDLELGLARRFPAAFFRVKPFPIPLPSSAHCAATNSRDWTALVLPTVVVMAVTRVRLIVPTGGAATFLAAS